MGKGKPNTKPTKDTTYNQKIEDIINLFEESGLSDIAKRIVINNAIIRILKRDDKKSVVAPNQKELPNKYTRMVTLDKPVWYIVGIYNTETETVDEIKSYDSNLSLLHFEQDE